MGNHGKVIMSVITGMGILSGCVLDDIAQYGESCPDLAYIETSEGQCMRDSCSWGSDFFKAHQCPLEYPYCILIPNEASYCTSECPDVTHALTEADLSDVALDDRHVCEADTVEHCGPDRDNCLALRGWVSGRCTNRTCVAEACDEYYLLDKKECKPYGMCCGVYCAQCTKEGWVCSGEDKNDTCIESCPQGQTNHEGLCTHHQSG